MESQPKNTRSTIFTQITYRRDRITAVFFDGVSQMAPENHTKVYIYIYFFI